MKKIFHWFLILMACLLSSPPHGRKAVTWAPTPAHYDVAVLGLLVAAQPHSQLWQRGKRNFLHTRPYFEVSVLSFVTAWMHHSPLPPVRSFVRSSPRSALDYFGFQGSEDRRQKERESQTNICLMIILLTTLTTIKVTFTSVALSTKYSLGF